MDQIIPPVLPVDVVDTIQADGLPADGTPFRINGSLTVYYQRPLNAWMYTDLEKWVD